MEKEEKEEKKKTMMATCNARGGDLDRDLISELPDSILHHILSFLDMTSVIETCILSKRWRYIWASLPFLNFDENAYDKQPEEFFPVFVDHVLIFRNQNSNIQTFRVSYIKREDNTILGHIHTWIHFLIRSNVQAIDLHVNTCHLDFDQLPIGLYTCKSLTSLKLDMGCYHYLDPQVVCLPALKTLHLKSLALDSSVEKLIIKCPVLETLIFYDCYPAGGNELTICNAQLKKLVVERMLAVHDNDKYLKFNLSAPNLKSFSSIYDLHCINHYSFVNVPSLENAEIDIEFSSYDYYTLRYSSKPKLLKRRKEGDIVNVVECLRGIYNVKSLTLSVWLLELVTKVPERWQSVQINPFCNLSLLQLKTSFSKLQLCAITYFLEKCPNLETLVLKVTKFLSPKFDSSPKSVAKVKCWEAELAPQRMMNHLKLVEIWDAVESVNELEFLKFLLKNAIFLEKMIVLTSKQQLANNNKRFTGFNEKLISFCGASSSTEIVFM